MGYIHVNSIFHFCTLEWISRDGVFEFPGINYMKNLHAITSNTSDFREVGSHYGFFFGCIAALDGWIVKISCATESDGVGGTEGVYYQKGFYGINVQAIVNKSNLLAW